MRFVELLSPDRIDTGLSVTSKSAALGAMASLLARGAPALGEAAILRALQAREETASTGVGDEVAVPHGRVAGLDKLVAALSLAPAGVEFDAIDGRPVRILVSIIAPERASGDHIRALACVARILHDGAARGLLLDARTPDEVLRIVAECDRS
ncbi:MAG: PTS sugar transporter subunit IIA [Polyangiales bacterium]